MAHRLLHTGRYVEDEGKHTRTKAAEVVWKTVWWLGAFWACFWE